MNTVYFGKGHMFLFTIMCILSVASAGARVTTGANGHSVSEARIGSGDGQIHIIPTLSAKSIKDGDRVTVQTVVKAMHGVAKVEARIERDPGQDAGVCAWFSDGLFDDLLGLPLAVIELKGAPMNLGGVNSAGTAGLWQAEWVGERLEEGYYHIAITVTDRTGHAYTDRSLTFTDPIAGNNAVGSAVYPNGGMRLLNTVSLPQSIFSAVIDPSAGYAYFVSLTSPSYVYKVALGVGSMPPTLVGSLILASGEYVVSAVIDTAAGYAYLGTDTGPGRVVKIALGVGAALPTRVGAITLVGSEGYLRTAVIDPAAGYAYFGSWMSPGVVTKVALGAGAALPTRIGSVTLAAGENTLGSSVIDPAAGYAYFGTWTSPGKVVRVALGAGAAPPARVGSITMAAGENNLTSAVIDTTQGYAYFGTYVSPASVVKVDVNPARTFQRVGAAVQGSIGLVSAAIDPASGYAYFVSQNTISKIALGAGAAPPVLIGSVTGVGSSYPDSTNNMVIDAASGCAYLGRFSPGGVVRVGLSQKGFLKATKFTMPESGIVTDVRFYSHLDGGFLRLALYSTASNPALLWQSGSINYVGGAGWVTSSIASGTPSSLTLLPGTYWLAWQVDTATPLASYTAGSVGDGLCVPMAYGAFPSGLQAGTSTAPILTDERWSEYVTYDQAFVSDPGGPYTISAGEALHLDGTGSFDLTPGGGIVNYEWDINNDSSWDFTGSTVDVMWSQLQTLGIGVSYSGTVRLRVTNSFGMSAIGTTTLDVLATPAAPVNPGSTAIGTDSITWTWQDAATNETGFKVYDDPGAGPPTTLQITTGADVQQWQHNALNPNTQYAFQVAAANASGDSAKTSNYSAWTLIEPVGGITWSSVGSSSITIAPATSYSNLTVGGSGLYFANTTAGTNSGWQQSAAPWTSTGLIPNTLYMITLVARNATYVETAPFSASRYTLAATPVAPIVSSPGVHSLDVAIGIGDENPAPTRYAIQVSPTVGGNTWVQPDGTLGGGAWWQTAAAWSTTTVTGLDENTSYFFVATAQNASLFTTSPGPAAGGTTLDGTPPGASITLDDPTPTELDTVRFSVDFSESVGTSFGLEDVSLTPGSLPGWISMSGTDPSYTIAVIPMDPDANGTVGISVGTGVTDLAGNPYAGGTSPLYTIANWPGFTAEPQDARKYSGDAHTFEVALEAGAGTISYQWKWDDGSKAVQNGPTTPTWSLSNLTPANAGDYWCEVTYNTTVHQTAVATLSVEDHLLIAQQPQGGTEASGGSHTFAVVTSGGYTPLSYQWSKDGALIPDATEASYTIAGLAATDTGDYGVEVSDSNADTLTSAPATLTVTSGLPAAGIGALALLGTWVALAIVRFTRKNKV